MPPDDTDYAPFRHLGVEKTPEYRRVLEAFAEARDAGRLLLRPAEVAEELAAAEADDGGLGEEEIVTLLGSLHAWGNLEKSADRARATTIEQFRRVGYLYSLSPAGLAAEQALGHFRERLGHEGALDRRALRRIRSYATALEGLLAAGDPTRDGFDLPKAQEAFERLVADFLQLAGEGRAFLLNLRTAIELQKLDLQEFLAYKQWLIGYLSDFLAELSETVPHVLEALERMEAHEPGRVGPLLDRLAADDAEHASRPGEAVYEERKRARRTQWAALTGWFRPATGRPSGAEDLRRWARSAIPQLLQAVQGIHDRRGRRSDRGADLATLARWFLDAPDDAAAHRLWRGVTGLHPARHLHVDAETLDARAATPIAASTAWADAPPLDLPIRLRRTGTLDKRGRGRKVTDRRAERAALRRGRRRRPSRRDAHGPSCRPAARCRCRPSPPSRPKPSGSCSTCSAARLRGGPPTGSRSRPTAPMAG